MHTLSLWGVTRLDGARGAQTDFGGVKPRQLLEVLAVRQGEPCDKDALADALWEGHPPSSYSGTVESHVSVLRRRLQAEGVPRTALRTVTGGYVLTDEIGVDLVRARDSLADALRAPASVAYATVGVIAPPPMRHLLASSPYAAWTIEAREEMRRLVAAAMRRASQGALERGVPDRALLLARRAQEEEPLSDATQQTLLRALIALDARCDALREYADFRRRLRSELGVEPSGTTQRIYLEVLSESAQADPTRSRLERTLLLRLLGDLPVEHEPTPWRAASASAV